MSQMQKARLGERLLGLSAKWSTEALTFCWVFQIEHRSKRYERRFASFGFINWACIEFPIVRTLPSQSVIARPGRSPGDSGLLAFLAV
jgi:hypothetical protein